MQIGLNRNSVMNNKNTPNFTAQIKGPAVYEAINRAKSAVELAEIREVVDNVANLGDKATEISLEKTGLVTITNSKLSRAVAKFKLKLNEKLDNPYIEMIKHFNTLNCVMDCERNLLEQAFLHCKNKKGLYDMYKGYNLSDTTKIALENIAAKMGIIPQRELNSKLGNLNVLKKMFFPEYFKF